MLTTDDVLRMAEAAGFGRLLPARGSLPACWHGQDIARLEQFAADAIAAAEAAQQVEQQADWKDFNDGYKAGAEEMRDGLLQLCKDFSDRQNRPYMGDVLAQVNSLCDLVLSEIPRSLEQQDDHIVDSDKMVQAEPVAWLVSVKGEPELGHWFAEEECNHDSHNCVPLYAQPPAVAVPDVLEQLQLAETEVINAKAWSVGEEAKKHCKYALTAIAVARAQLSAAQKPEGGE